MLESAAVTVDKRRAGRPARYTGDEKQKLTRPSVRLLPDQASLVDALAHAEATSVNDLFLKLVAEAVERHPNRGYIEDLAGKILRGEVALPRAKRSQRRK